ncbi:serine/threonine-protein kinase [Hamadaea sp. NPDC050747]|uniref:serine/threonine-protein kinase n=1 Tax=Hamadaea sp. NPDC050747 TaxID=3155789 RepID=UPI0033F6CF6D
MVKRVSLENEWIIGERLGGGGFGQIYVATSDDGQDAVAKFVPKEPGAQRELLFADLTDVRNVVPILDSGETADSWVLVMPRAERSLREHLDAEGGPMALADVLPILTDLAEALVSMEEKVVHRDVKPENVLLLEGRWCLADFGISRYAESATAPDTRKYALTPAYAAPERWKAERSTSAADVYAFGVIAYELFAGEPPFRGPYQHDFRQQHLHDDPGHLAAAPALFAALVEECLYKSPGSRPSPSNLLARLSKLERPAPTGGLAKLNEANRTQVKRRSDLDRQKAASRSEDERREDLAQDAVKALLRISETLRTEITEAAGTASVQLGKNGGWSIRLGSAQIEFDPWSVTSRAPWGSWTPPAFEVIAHSALGIRIPPNRSEYEGRVHSLWFCDAQQAGRYQWFETAFMVSPMIPRRRRQNPFGFDPCEEAAKALWTGIAEWQVAWPFTPLAVGDLDDFVSRWAGWFADAANGSMGHPGRMPEGSPPGTWRRS